MGIKVYGNVSDPVTTFVPPGIAVSVAVTKTGVPYITNTKNELWSKPIGGAWT
jgi:hypothetical protein